MKKRAMRMSRRQFLAATGAATLGAAARQGLVHCIPAGPPP